MTAINENVNFTATLKAGTAALANKPVTVYHTFNGVRADDVTTNTSATGTVTTTQKFDTAGTRKFFAEFKGDTTYDKSTSPEVNIVVGNAGELTSGPAVCATSATATDLFAVGTDGGLWHTRRSNNVWGSWDALSGKLLAGTMPTACATGDGHIEVFVTGTDKSLYQKSYNGTSWSSWKGLGGVLPSSPDAISPAAGVIEVYGRGTDNHIWCRQFKNSVWSAWKMVE